MDGHRVRRADRGASQRREAMLERQCEGIAKAKREGPIRAVCRPHAESLMASRPRKSPAEEDELLAQASDMIGGKP